MLLRPLLRTWEKVDNYNNIIEKINEDSASPVLISGLEGSQRNFLMASLYENISKTSLIITGDSIKAERIYEDILTFLPEDEVFLCPNRDFIIGEEMLGQSRETGEQRLKLLELLSANKKLVVVAPVNAVLFRLMPFNSWNKLIVHLRCGQVLDLQELIKKLVLLGYERTPLIDGKGQFSVRGDIADIFPPGQNNPVRIQFFDNVIESLRTFDCITQRSVDALETIRIVPAAEVIMPEDILNRGLERIEEELSGLLEKMKGRRETAQKLKEKAGLHLAKMRHYVLNDAFYGYFSYFYNHGDSLLDYLNKYSLVMVDDPVRTTEAADVFLNRIIDFQNDLLLQGDAFLGNIPPAWSLSEILSRSGQSCFYFSLFKTSGLKVPRHNSFSFTAKDVPNYFGQWDLLRNEIKLWKKEGYKIYFLSPSEKQAEAFHAHLCDQDIYPQKKPGAQDAAGSILLAAGNLANGFLVSAIKTVLIPEQNIFPGKKKKRKLAGEKEGLRLRDYNELSPGDYVVHEQHGIGKYLGVQTLDIENTKKDYLHIRYAGEDKLFIPIEQIELIKKYVGVEGKAPRLNRLGSSEWQRIKNKVESSVQDLAAELLSICAARQSLKGRSYSVNHSWQGEFESYFPYEETADQLQSINEVRADLARIEPMDRLLCGDVGFGKTEVAMRAAFTVVMEGKQVAVLAPTTILAHQHFRNFRERFAQFPVKVSLLSRFLSAAEQKETINKTGRGNIDILIGTHRLLSKDIKFKDLGLIVIDEEHRFGVRHKEKLKKLRLDADVLTLTATPIPRTLHMSIVGARDLSLIETPPENRYPVQTYVLEYSDQFVKEAISRELARSGQVYYVFNQVKHIDKWSKKLKELVPEARIAVAHGQMNEDKLESVMNDFLEGNYDILLTTTIIEAGLDIPNVNTLIVYNADRFGLAQLYQLRGRVGRSSRLAYAYLTFQRDKVLTEAAEKRLQAIKEFAELGSGFKIALRDLEIRGAGNILGPEQHGFMAAVGFDLYCRLLEEAVKKYKGEETVQKVSPRMDLKISAYLPSSYIFDQEQKIELYQRIYSLETYEEVEEISSEMNDRFGSLPLEAENLLLVARLRVLASNLNITSIQHENGKVNMKFDQDQKFDSTKLWHLVKKHPGKVSLSAGREITMKINPNLDKDGGVHLAELENLLILAKEVVI